MGEGIAMGARFQLLGSVEAQIDGQVVDVGPARQRCVLVALLAEIDCVVSADQLIDRVWGDSPPPGARSTLHSYLSRLRAALAGVENLVIGRRSGGYVLSADAATVDLHCFRELVARARTTTADERAAALLGQAVGLWRGEAFAGLDTPWLNNLRDAVDKERREAELDHVDLRLRCGQHAGLLSELHARAADHPLDERVAGQLMLALCLNGRQAEALDCYQRIRSHLAEHLGVDPSPALRQRHRQILAGSAPAPDTSAQPRCDLPRDTSEFTGRVDEMRHLRTILTADGTGAVVISAIDGMAGVGKTALAVHAAHQFTGSYPDAQLFLDLRAHTEGHDPIDPATALDILLRALGVPSERIPEGLDTRAGLWRAELAHRKVILVLDNATSAKQVSPLLPGTATSLVLVTSRRRLPDLDATRLLSLDVLSPSDAAALFARVLADDRISAEPDAVDEIVRLCGYLPLAIRIAAARLRARPAWTLGHLLRRLRELGQRLDELAYGDRMVTAAFRLSYQDLTPAMRRLFRLSGLIPCADFDSYLAANLAGTDLAETEQVLEDLVDAHLVQQPSAGRYRLHDLLRVYAARLATEVDPAEERDAALNRLYGYYRHTAALALEVIAPRDDHRRTAPADLSAPIPALSTHDTALTWLETERHNLLATATHATGPDLAAHVHHLSAILSRYLDCRGYHDDALTLHTHALATARASGEVTMESHALCNLGAAHERLGRNNDALAHHTRALALARQANDPALESRVLNNLGNVFMQTGAHNDALTRYQQALALTSGNGDRVSQGHTFNNLGIIYERLGRYDEAITAHRRALALAEETHDAAGRGYALHTLGIAYERTGHYDEALSFLRNALVIAYETGNRSLEGYTTQAMSTVHHRLGNRHDAITHLRHALDIARDTGNRGLEAEVVNGLGEIARTSDPTDALVHHHQALVLATDTGDRFQQARAHDGLGCAHHSLHHPNDAHRHWTHALALYTECGVPEAGIVHSYLEKLEE